MPRNCGCENKCSCVIREGTGVSVTGTGRPQDPYVISSVDGGDGSGFDTGDLKWSARATAPAGWLVCDGAAVSRSVYEDLFAAVGVRYGTGDGTTTFNLPDYTGRFMLGADGAHVQGSSGGSETKTLSADHLPSHTHTINHDHPSVATSTIGNHQHVEGTSPNDGSSSLYARRASATGGVRDTALGDPAGAHSHTVDLPAYTGASGATGGGQPFDSMPPYGTALPLIKT